jgi:hypothetical protein
VAEQKQKSEAIVRMQKAEEESAGVKGGSPMVVGLLATFSVSQNKQKNNAMRPI